MFFLAMLDCAQGKACDDALHAKMVAAALEAGQEAPKVTRKARHEDQWIAGKQYLAVSVSETHTMNMLLVL